MNIIHYMSIRVVLSLCLSVFARCLLSFVYRASPISSRWYFNTGNHTKLQYLWKRRDRIKRQQKKTCFSLIYYNFNTLHQLETLHKCFLLFLFLEMKLNLLFPFRNLPSSTMTGSPLLLPTTPFLAQTEHETLHFTSREKPLLVFLYVFFVLFITTLTAGEK